MPSSAVDGAFDKARADIYAAHDGDPNKVTVEGNEVAYETHYAQRMEHFLTERAPDASEVLKLAVCAQHFRRWEVPRSDYPMTKPGYLLWRTHLKKRQADLVMQIMDHYYPESDTKRCHALIKKEGLNQGEEEVQILEDVACLVFLDDQFEDFKDKHDEEKMVNILRKTWGKMSKKGQDLALNLNMTDECRTLVQKALAG